MVPRPAATALLKIIRTARSWTLHPDLLNQTLGWGGMFEQALPMILAHVELCESLLSLDSRARCQPEGK
jgi:hypothetical protein